MKGRGHLVSGEPQGTGNAVDSAVAKGKVGNADATWRTSLPLPRGALHRDRELKPLGSWRGRGPESPWQQQGGLAMAASGLCHRTA